MEESSGIEIVLTGGPMDGETIQLSPQGSIEPPGVLSYMTVHQEKVCWMSYGAGRLGEPGGWPKTQERRQYHFWGYCELIPL